MTVRLDRTYAATSSAPASPMKRPVRQRASVMKSSCKRRATLTHSRNALTLLTHAAHSCSSLTHALAQLTHSRSSLAQLTHAAHSRCSPESSSRLAECCSRTAHSAQLRPANLAAAFAGPESIGVPSSAPVHNVRVLSGSECAARRTVQAKRTDACVRVEQSCKCSRATTADDTTCARSFVGDRRVGENARVRFSATLVTVLWPPSHVAITSMPWSSSGASAETFVRYG